MKEEKTGWPLGLEVKGGLLYADGDKVTLVRNENDAVSRNGRAVLVYTYHNCYVYDVDPSYWDNDDPDSFDLEACAVELLAIIYNFGYKG